MTIQEIRKKQGLTQIDLAEKAGIAQSTLAKIELGQTRPTMKTLQLLSRVLKRKINVEITKHDIKIRL